MTVDGIPFSFATSGIQLQPIAWEHRYFNPGRLLSPQGVAHYDDEGIAGAAREQRWMDGPVVAAGILSTRLDSYVVSGEQVFLNLAIRHAERMAAIAYRQDGALYFPYMYEWNLHAFVDYPMEVPWFSGMAQGYMLGCYSRLYAVTQNPRWLEFAQQVFESFLLVHNNKPLWTTDLIDGEYLWFEEYARTNGESDRAFNGHMYATWGLHDYWMATGDPRAQALVDGGLTSILHFMDRWRYPGGQSFYCMTHYGEQIASYHGLHIRQLVYAYSMTGDSVWMRLADVFTRDYPQLVQRSGIFDILYVEPGIYNVKRAAAIRPESVIEVEITEPLDLAWDFRSALVGDMVVSARCSVEPYKGLWFEEIPGRVWTRGLIDHLAWPAPLELAPVQGQVPQLWKYDPATDELESIEGGVQQPGPLYARARAKLHGVHCYQLSEGPHTGMWVPVDELVITQ